ncbi:hypothetical protein Fmac_020527 [Flemingia macrophylla]|uniref:Disease resistance RPP13-like protein 1 n=1 Tax=Flemingia macrophylla TaxID=520843 RepID=A0ABD1LUB7_9FABA
MVVEWVCGALLSSFFQVLFDRLLSRQVLGYFGGTDKHEMLLNKLKVNLLSINAVVDDAEQKQFSNSYVKAWLDGVKDALFDAEDVLDEIDYEVSKCMVEGESHFKSKSVNTFISRIEQVLLSLEVLSSQKDHLGLKNASGGGVGPGSSSKVSQKLPSSSLVIETDIYGRNGEKEIIFNWLTHDNPNPLTILSIVGMGGVGKTTLVQHVYNDPKVENARFSIKAWVCISDDFDVLHVSRAILEAVTKSRDNSGDLEMVHGRLKKKLLGKKFLLVLDDVWNERRDKWEVVQTPLNYGAEGSVILVTTRSEKVAFTMRSDKVHHLKQLQEDYCWQVFAKQALQDDNFLLNVELKKIGMKIVEKCKGLPLALKTIGSFLHTKSSISEWERVLTSEIWDLPNEDGQIIPALLLSYHNLPSHLKRCFSYCALFPKDYVFVEKNLIQVWMIENFLRCPQQTKTPEEIGKQYFDDLLSRCFFEKSSRYETSFVMHDLLNDLAKYVCGDFCFRLGVDNAERLPKSTRHFSFPINHNLNFVSESLNDAKRLRTFMPTKVASNSCYWRCEWSIICELFSKFELLRHLSFSYCYELEEVPDSLRYLKLLRSLDLSSTSIKILPDSICFLYNLQILKLNSCPCLKELPRNMHTLINLRHLEFLHTNVTDLPMYLGKLKNLLILSSFYVGKGSKCSIEQLGKLNLHGRLSIGQLQNIDIPSDALAANLKNKPHLVDLALDWSQDWELDDLRKENENEVLENLQPSEHLTKLSISNYGGTKFPSWLVFLSRLVSLSLVNCKNCERLPSKLGLLPSLKYLKFNGLMIIVIDADFYGSSSSSFTSLESLEFSNMVKWKAWELDATKGAFPRLQHLSITGCPNLEKLPEQLLGLKKLNISDCKKLVAWAPKAPKIHELELQNCGKLQFNDYPATLKRLTIGGQHMEASLLDNIQIFISKSSLEYVGILNCPDMKIFKSHCYRFLETLEIRDGCSFLRTFPLDDFPKLSKLYLKCRNLQNISQKQPHSHLKDFEICDDYSSEFVNFENPFEPVVTLFPGEELHLPWKERSEELVNIQGFQSFPSEGLSAPSLKRLRIQRLTNLKLLPSCMHMLLQSLDELHIEDCPNVELLPNGVLPSNLKRMNLLNCSKLIASLKWALRDNTSLEVLSIQKVDMKFFPRDVFLPLSLTCLHIYDCPNLEQLDYKGLHHLSSLKELILNDCPWLECLPKDGLPKSISTLQILGNCQRLKQRCQKEGADWGKIQHIENLYVDMQLHMHEVYSV